jgi:penicillin-binding protein 1C
VWAILKSYTVGVWVGNFNGQSMWDVSGVSGAAPVWRDVMDYLHRSTASRAPKPPAGVVRQQVAYQPELESARAASGSSPAPSPLIALVRDEHRSPKILYPGDASIGPRSRHSDATQRVFFLAQGGQGCGWHWTASRWRKPPLTTLAPTGQRNGADRRQCHPIATTRFQVRGASQHKKAGARPAFGRAGGA